MMKGIGSPFRKRGASAPRIGDDESMACKESLSLPLPDEASTETDSPCQSPRSVPLLSPKSTGRAYNLSQESHQSASHKVTPRGGLRSASNKHLAQGFLGFISGANEELQTQDDVLDMNGRSPMYKIASSGDFERLQWLLEAQWSPNIANRDGATPFHAACSGGHLLIVKKLLAHGSLIDQKTDQGIVPLHLAAKHGHARVVRLLVLLPGIQLNVAANDGETPLSLAVREGHLGVCHLLLNQGVYNVNRFVTTTGDTLLHLACQHRHAEVVRLLLQRNADVSCVNVKGFTPLETIAYRRSNWLETFSETECYSEEEEKQIAFVYQKVLEEACSSNKAVLFAQLRDCENFKPYRVPGQSVAPMSIALKAKCFKIAEALLDLGAQVIDIGSNLPEAILTCGSEQIITKALILMIGGLTKKSEVLDFSHCNLEFIPVELVRCLVQLQDQALFSRVRAISFGYNELQSLPVELLDLHERLDVRLEGNPLQTLSDVDRRAGWSRIREYLASIRDRAKQWRDCKIMILGQESTGKSTLLRSLANRKNKPLSKLPNVATNGIHIRRNVIFRLKDDSPDSYSNAVRFNVWDFGGQEVFYPTHRFFLTYHGVYLLVFRLSSLVASQNSFESESRVSYWMQQLRHAMGTSNTRLIYLVGTHLDEVNDPKAVDGVIDHLTKIFPKQRFPGMQGVCAVSSKTGEGINELKKRILQDVQEKQIFPLVSPSWVKFYDHLFPSTPALGDSASSRIAVRSRTEQSAVGISNRSEFPYNWLTEEHFKELAERFGLGEDIAQVIEFFKNIGALLTHQSNFPSEKGSLNSLIILNPQWLGNLMSTLISFNHTWIKNGFLHFSDVKHVFAAYEPHLHNILLDLLENFNIIYRVKLSASPSFATRSNSNNSQQRGFLEGILVPSMLSEHPQMDQFWELEEDVDEIGRIYSFPFFPLGLIEQIIVRIFHISGFIPHYFWRYGGFFYFRAWDNSATMYKIFLSFDPVKFRLSLRLRSMTPTSGRSLTDSKGSSSSRGMIFSLLVDTIVTSLEEFKLNEALERFIPCSHCVRIQAKKQTPQGNSVSSPRSHAELNQVDYSTVFLFTYSECVDALLNGDRVVFCHHIRSPSRLMEVQQLAPDIGLCGIPMVAAEDIKVECQLGAGGFGNVYRGTLKENSEEVVVAIKEANISMTEADYVYSEFCQEIFVMSQIEDHPNLLKFFGVSLSSSPQMVLEFASKGDLAALISNHDQPHNLKTFPLALRLRIALDVAQGMEALHGQLPPIIHRDLRTPNIFLKSLNPKASVTAVVADFGLSRIAVWSLAGPLESWQWLAPEIIGLVGDTDTNKGTINYGCPSDVYSFAICCWQLVTCEDPFLEYNNDSRFHRVNQDGQINIMENKIKRAICQDALRPTLPDSAISGFPEEFFRIIRDCWKSNPRERATFAEIVPRLQRVCKAFSPPSQKETPNRNHPARKQGLLRRKKKAQNNKEITFDSQVLIASVKNSPKNNEKKRISARLGLSPMLQYQDEVSLTAQSRLPMRQKVTCACVYSAGTSQQQLWIGTECGDIAILNATAKNMPVSKFWSASRTSVINLTVVGEHVWSASGGTISIWDTYAYRLTKSIKVVSKKKGKIKAFYSCGPYNTVWVSLEEQKTLHILNSQNYSRTSISPPRGSTACAFVLHKEHLWVASGKQVLLYSPDVGELIAMFEAHDSPIVSMMSTSSDRVWTASNSGEIAIWHVENLDINCEQRRTEHKGSNSVSLMDWKTERVWTWSPSQAVLWDSHQNKPIQEFELGTIPMGQCVSLDDSGVFFVRQNGTVELYNTANTGN